MSISLSLFAGVGAQLFTDSGSPLSGGLVYTYLAGTSTPVTSYTSVSGITANSNPIVLNAAGRTPAEVWLTDGVGVKFVVKTATGTTIGTYDNVFSTDSGGTDVLSLLAASSGSSLVGFLQAGTGAVARTVQSKERDVVSVKDFGAVGDGVTDDAAAIDAACKAVFTAGGGTLYIPKGTYLLGTLSSDPNSYSSYITARNGVNFVGDGIGVSVLKVKSGENARFFSSNAPYVIATQQAAHLTNVRFADFTVDWNGANNLLTALMTPRNNAAIFAYYGVENFVVERVEVKETPGNQCVFVNGANYNANPGKNVTVRNCVFTNSGSGLVGNYNLDHSSVYIHADNVLVENNKFSATQNVLGACYEIHGSNGTGLNNVSAKYKLGFYLAADGAVTQTTAGSFVVGESYNIGAVGSTNFVAIGAAANTVGTIFYATGVGLGTGTASAANIQSNLKVLGDIHTELSQQAFSVVGNRLKNVQILDSSFSMASGGTYSVGASFVNGNSMAAESMTISRCRFTGLNFANLRFASLQYIDSFTFSENEVSSFAGTNAYGILINGVANASGNAVKNLKIINNIFNNVLYPVYANCPAVTAPSVVITGNTFIRTVAEATQIVTMAFSSSNGYVRDNTYDPNYSNKFALASSNGIQYDDSGTWTPSIGGNATYNINAGSWLRVGKQITVSFDLHVLLIGTGSQNTISGLPFNIGTLTTAQISFFTNTAINVVSLSASAGGALFVLCGTTAAAVSMTYAINALTSNSHVIGSVTYSVA